MFCNISNLMLITSPTESGTNKNNLTQWHLQSVTINPKSRHAVYVMWHKYINPFYSRNPFHPQDCGVCVCIIRRFSRLFSVIAGCESAAKALCVCLWHFCFSSSVTHTHSIHNGVNTVRLKDSHSRGGPHFGLSVFYSSHPCHWIRILYIFCENLPNFQVSNFFFFFCYKMKKNLTFLLKHLYF